MSYSRASFMVPLHASQKTRDQVGTNQIRKVFSNLVRSCTLHLVPCPFSLASLLLLFPAIPYNSCFQNHRLMILSKKLCFSCCTLLFIAAASCDKDNDNVKEVTFPPKDITYVVKGTNIKLNFIDSQSVFQRDRVFKDSFHYAFKKGPGAQIGISVNSQSPADTIYSWHIFINGKLYANAFSVGGAYLTVPYD